MAKDVVTVDASRRCCAKTKAGGRCKSPALVGKPACAVHVALYRNLTARDRVVYYQRRVGRRRLKISTKTDDWNEAAAFRDLYEARKGIAHGVTFLAAEPPRFADFVKEYLAAGIAHLGPDHTSRARESAAQERAAGAPLQSPAPRPDHGADAARVVEQRDEASEDRGTKTGREYVNTLAAVLEYADELGHLRGFESPIPTLRATLRKQARTQRGRAQADPPTRDICPIVDSAAVGRLVEGARQESTEALVYVLLMLDAGLRDGEARGLHWGRVAWGEDENDTSRALLVDASRSGKLGILGPTKSGRARKVALARRLRAALALLYRERFEPSPDALVLGDVNPEQFYSAPWRRICKRAQTGHLRRKDLRDTFASWLVSLGIPTKYVANQLGHKHTTTTENHYARWIPEGYVEPARLEPGEVPADLLAQLEKRPQSDPTSRVPAARPSTESEQFRGLTGGPPGTRTMRHSRSSAGLRAKWWSPSGVRRYFFGSRSRNRFRAEAMVPGSSLA